MKLPERNREFRDLIAYTVRETGQPINLVENIVEQYFQIVAQGIQWDKPITIHIDYIGDLVFNQKWHDKIKQINDNRNKV